MSTGRRVSPSLVFGGTNVDVVLKDYLERVTYEDVASGSSDTLSITLQNIDGNWLGAWYPQKGNMVSGSLNLHNWGSGGGSVQCGSFTLDDIKMSFGPRTAQFSCVSAPTAESFKTRKRDKTWEKITIQGIAAEICARYGLALNYSGPAIMIDRLEQSDNDSSFLMKLCEEYGLAMKIYMQKLVIYDIVMMEAAGPVAALSQQSFVSGDLTITDGLYGTYTGARVSYTPPTKDEEFSVFVGLVGEEAPGSRVLKVDSACSSEAEARLKGAAQVNRSNLKATTLSGSLFPNTAICAGVCVELGSDFGKLAGKYFVDKVTWEAGGSATKQKIEAHKVQEKVTA